MAGRYRTFTVALEGIPKAIQDAANLERRIKRGGLRMALTKATADIVKRAKALAPRESGMLRKSIKRKIKTNTRRDTVTVIIGSDKSVHGTYKGQERKPARYMHLVELGHGGPHPAAPRPFLRPAYEGNKSAMQAKFKAELKRSIEKVQAKLSK